MSFNNYKKNEENKPKPLSERESKILHTAEKIVCYLGKKTEIRVDDEECIDEIVRYQFEDGLLSIDKKRYYTEHSYPRDWLYIVIIFNGNIVFDYRYSDGLKIFIDSKWVDLLSLYDQKANMEIDKLNRRQREFEQKSKVDQRLKPYFEYIALCYKEKKSVYNYIKTILERKRIILTEDNDRCYINGLYNGEYVFNVFYMYNSGSILKYNCSCLNEIESAVKLAMQSEGRLIMEDTDRVAEQEIQRLKNTLKSDKK